MNNPPFTAAWIAALQPPTAGQLEYPDPAKPGLVLRISQGGSKTWFVRYRADGHRRRYRLGAFPQLGLAEARREATRYLGKVIDNQDPAAQRAQQKAEETFAEIAEVYLERHAIRKRRSGRNFDERTLRNMLIPEWGAMRMGAIKRRHIIALLDGLVDRGVPSMATRVKSLISSVFHFAENRDLIEYNPALRLPSPPLSSRDRVFSADELRRLFAALESEPVRHQALVKVALLTAARRSEVMNMTWAEVGTSADSTEVGDVWVLPAARAKNGREHRVPLTASVKAALQSLPRTREFVFHSGHDRLRMNAGRATRVAYWFPQVLQRAGIPGAVFHDLRRSAATHMAELRVNPRIIERCLNHVQGGVQAIYNRFSYDKEKRAALEKWERRLQAILGEPTTAKVIRIAG